MRSRCNIGYIWRWFIDLWIVWRINRLRPKVERLAMEVDAAFNEVDRLASIEPLYPSWEDEDNYNEALVRLATLRAEEENACLVIQALLDRRLAFFQSGHLW